MSTKGALRLIGVVGRAQSGKSTLAALLLDQLGKEWERKAFALKLKTMVERLYDLPSGALSEGAGGLSSAQWKAKESLHAFTYGRLLQLFGGMMRSAIKASFWVDLLFESFSSGSHWVVEDVRMPSEADRIRKLGGKLIGIRRPSKLCDGRRSDDPSETQVEEIAVDVSIENTGSLSDLSRSAEEALAAIR